MQTYAYGFPRLGKSREYKKIIEGFWKGMISENELRKGIHDLEKDMLSTYKKFVDKFPIGEMTLYDNMLDTATMVGLYKFGNLADYYNFCRGKNALEMTKWFNTNYHYLVPKFQNSGIPAFSLNWNKPKEVLERHRKGIPYLIGPFTFLKLSKGISSGIFKECLLSLVDVYIDLIKDFKEVHIDEPAFVMELPREEIIWIKKVYDRLGSRNHNINLFTYYDSVDFLKDLYELPIKAIGLDFINGKENLISIREHGFPEGKILIAGIVNGRNIWRTDIGEAVEFLRELSRYTENLIISNAAPLYHLPITIENEQLDERLSKNIAFAEERLAELKLIAQIYKGKKQGIKDKVEVATFGINPNVQQRIKNLKDEDFKKITPYNERIKKQKKILNLPLFPTTTIGSFPQTKELRKKRADFKSGKISENEYRTFIKEEIRKLIKLQENLDLDVFVHGEFERTDMVEYFAQKLDGVTNTKYGWIISYGTRGYRPPIIYGDVSRRKPMTLKEIIFAQSITKKPVKGMLTGPVTIISWSFVRDDIPIYEVAYQIALCFQDEIKDYEKEGIKIVQIDEPAFREKAPVKKRNWGEYFNWAVKSFNLASQSKPKTQIHTHMCYSEFGEIIEYILKMDFDVITIEASRSRGDVIKCFKNVDFKRQIGLGVWDIHSPTVPNVEDMAEIVNKSLGAFEKRSFWINPDCGLKTRNWKETIASLKNLVELAKRARKWS
ncbi:MAG: 5-methyltetrahydropteroyltriglutamate--homocysteine S-methyltransferase [Candidatus Neomarinimicrobiota bacterium]|nr:MAG: 5-methyltetrahydropteroyltriglutamate--homocysteine S-methyltransferase [Candidatus Neomarinimicrobiota bacterium]